VSAATTFAIEGMHCASCASRVERALADVPGVQEAAVNLATGTALARGAFDANAATAAVAAIGYGARVLAEPEPLEVVRAREAAERADRRRRTLVAVLGAAGTMALMPFGHVETAPFQVLTSTPVVFWAGAEFFVGAWRAGRAPK
jgi:cation transport ATPase